MENKSIGNEILEGSFWAGFANFLNKIGALILNIILARFLMPELFGIYSFILSIVSIFMVIGEMGVNETLGRYLSLNNKKLQISAYFQYILKLKFMISIIISFALLLLAYPISFWLLDKPIIFKPLILFSFYIFSSSITSFLTSVFYAFKKTKYLGLKEFIFQTTQIILIFSIFSIFSNNYYIFGIILSMIVSNLIISIFLVFWLKKSVPFIFEKSYESINKKNLLKFISFTSIASVSGMIFTYVDTIILGFFVPFEYIGYYRVAFSLILGVISLFSYLSLILIPIFTKLAQNELESASRKFLRIIFILTIPATFGILALGNYFIKILYGDSYLFASSSFAIFSLILVIYIPITLFSTILFSKGKAKEVAKINIISLFFAILLELILVFILSRFSYNLVLIGASSANVLSRVIMLISLLLISRKYLRIKVDKSSFVKPLIASIVMFFSIFFINLFFIKHMTLFIGILEILWGVLVYVIIMILIKGLTKEDMNLIKMIPFKEPFILLSRYVSNFFVDSKKTSNENVETDKAH